MLDIIKKRKSIRGYSDSDLNPYDEKEVGEILKNTYKGLFGNEFSFIMIGEGLNDYKGKIGTYGFITGRFYCVCAWCKNNKNYLIDYGYTLENIVLSLTKLNISTCWLGGTFNKSNIIDALGVRNDNESTIPAIITLGYNDNKIKLRHRLISFKPKDKKRKRFNELFLDKDLKPIVRNDLYSLFEAIQWAPSAVNYQPWRLIIIDNTIHFYNADTKGNPMHYLDMGIALCHFDGERKYQGLDGEWLKNQEVVIDNNWNYIISFKIK
ncbi:MAG: nitroreductase family protein [Eubacteriaceae bacterium]